MEKLYACEEVAARYGIKVPTLWRWIRERKIRAVKAGKGYLVPESAIAEFEDQGKTKERATCRQIL